MTTIKIFNGTPHNINIVEGAVFNASIRKYVGGEVVSSIPSNGILNASISTVKQADIAGIPIYEKKIWGCDDLPYGYDMYIVSALYSSAIQKEGVCSKVYTVADPVYTEDGNSFIGCRGLAPAF